MVNKKLHEVAEGDIDLMIELLDIFFSQESKYRNSMLEFSYSKDWESLARVAHRFHPSTVYVGLTEISEKLRLLENTINENEEKQGSENVFSNLFLSILEDLAKARSELQSHREQLVKQRDHQ